MVALVDHAIDAAAVTNAVRDARFGAVITFEGVTRDHHDGRGVKGLYYEAYAPLALAELRAITAEVAERWPGARAAMVHRLGEVPIGEASVVIAVGAAHRDEAYVASRYAIDQLKARAAIWKRETYDDGTAWVANKP